MTEARTFELVESIMADFGASEWTVCPVSKDFHVGAGLYLMVPVKDAKQAEVFKDLLAGAPF